MKQNMAKRRPATDSGDEKKQLGCKEIMINIDDSPDIEPGQWHECCIYRVPELLRRVKKEAYTPKLVHIGPLHYSMQQPKYIELHKRRYLKEFCDRTKKSQNDLADIIRKDELEIRNCYSETFDRINSKEFVEMILLDAIFIIEFILRNHGDGYNKDHILNKPFFKTHIRRDLILLENQLPYFVLKKLLNFVLDGQENQQGQDTPFLELACNFLLEKKNAVMPKGKEVRHLTDLIRTYYNLPHLSLKRLTAETVQFYGVCSATKLDEVGVKFKVAPPSRSLLDIKFIKKKWLDWCPCLTFSWLLACLPCLKCFACLERMQTLFEIPRLEIDDVTEGIFRNIMALEQFHYPMEAHFCAYVALMDFIIDNEKDIELLVEKKIIVNRLGSNVAAVTFINKLCLQIVTPGTCYGEAIEGLRHHYDDHWSRIMGTMARVYFGDFWRGAATVIGLLVLVNSLRGFLQPFVVKK